MNGGNHGNHWAALAAAIFLVGAAEAQPYADAVLDLDPVGYWRLDETGGTTAWDASGRGLHGTYHGRVAMGRPGALSTADAAAGFAGGCVQIPHDDRFRCDSGTLTFWCRAAGGATNGGLVSKDAAGFGAGGHLTLRNNENGYLYVHLQSAEAEYLVTAPHPIAADRWYYIAFTFGAGGMTLHVDGDLIDSNPYTGGLAGNREPLVLGANTWASAPGGTAPLCDPYLGLLDEVALFDRALTREQIHGLYQAAATPEPATAALLAAAGAAGAGRRMKKRAHPRMGRTRRVSRRTSTSSASS